MYAIFRALGKQFRAVPDAVIRIPTLDAEPGSQVTFDEVLLAADDGDVHVGSPALNGAAVEAEVVRHGRGEKIIVYKMKRRKGYRKKQGHRQGFTEIRIVDIAIPSGKPARPDAPKAEAKKRAEPKAKAEPASKAEAPKKEAEAAPEPEARKAKAEATEVGAKAAPEPEAPKAEAPAADEIDITDAARELAEERGIDLTKIEGTGKDGRILKSDIDKAVKAQESD